MEGRTYALEDADSDELATAIAARLDPGHRYGGRGFDVLVVEEYEFWRTNSNMQATVIVDGTGDDCCVEVLVGGGATGIFQFTAGSEAKVLGGVTEDVEDAFDELGVEVATVESLGAPFR